MLAKLRSSWISVNASYWFYPAIFSVLAAMLAFVTVAVDRAWASEYVSHVDWLSPARPDGARTTLTVIAGSMIGVASTVFSITIAAVAYASGNYGPRLLTNFMEDRGNQLSLGTFISTFVYSVMVLRVVRSEGEQAMSVEDAVATIAPGFVPQLSLLIATVLAGIAVGVLVYFLNHIPSSIRINIVLEGIGERLIDDLEDRFPDDDDCRETIPRPSGAPVVARRTGYVKLIDFATLDAIAEKADAVILLKVRTGDFLHPDMTVAEIAGDTIDDVTVKRIVNCFALGGRRTPTQDLEFLIDELVEIALRALSPGINDPFTAITSMHWLGAATAEFARRDLSPGPEQDDYSQARVLPLADDFAHFLSRGFGGIRSSAAESPLAAINFLDCLFASATAASSQPRRNAIAHEGAQLLAQARIALSGPSLDDLETRYADFREAMERPATKRSGAPGEADGSVDRPRHA